MANRSHAPIPTRPARSHASAGLLATLSALEVRAATAESERAGTSIRAHSRAGPRADRSRSRDLRSRSPKPLTRTLASNFTRFSRRTLALAVVGGAVLVAAVAVLIGGCGGSSSAPAKATPPRTQQLETIFEAQSQLFANPSVDTRPAPATRRGRRQGVHAMGLDGPRPALAHPPALRRRLTGRLCRGGCGRRMTRSSATPRPAGSASTSRSRRPPRCGRPHRASARHLARIRRRLGALGQGVRRCSCKAVGTRYSGSYTPAGAGARCRPCASGRSGTSRTRPAARPAGDRQLERRDLAAATTGSWSTRPGRRSSRPATGRTRS